MVTHALTAKNATKLLLFLFPLAGNIVQHWTGAIYACFLILALIVRPWRTSCLAKNEKRFLLFAVLLFVSAIASNFFNTWTETQTKGLGVLVRYLAFVPIYILIRDQSNAFKSLAYGSCLGAILLAIFTSLETIGTGSAKAYGIYMSPGLIATQATVFILVVTHALRDSQRTSNEFWFLLVGLGCGIHSLTVSGSRSGYVAALILGILYIFLEVRPKLRLLVFSGLFASLALLFQLSQSVRTQSISAVSEINRYLNSEENLTYTGHQSVGQRLEMWRVSIEIIKDNPLLGVGWRNFSSAAYPHVEAGRANPQVLGSPHPHNTYLEFLVSFGLSGFLFLALLLITLFQVVFVSTKRDASLLKYFLLFYLINGINEGGLFIYGNSLSFFLVYVAVLAADLLKADKSVIDAQRNNGNCASAPSGAQTT